MSLAVFVIPLKELAGIFSMAMFACIFLQNDINPEASAN